MGVKISEIVAGSLTGDAAVEILRAELQAILAVEEEIRQRRALVAAAENKLIYGDEGRPSRFPAGSAFTSS